MNVSIFIDWDIVFNIDYPIWLIVYLLSEHIIITYPAPDNVPNDKGRVMKKIYFQLQNNTDSSRWDEHIFVCIQ